MAGQIFFHEDENGVKQDVEHLAEFLNDEDAELNSTMLTIQEYVSDGGTLEEAIELFGSEELLAAFSSGELQMQDIKEAIEESLAD